MADTTFSTTPAATAIPAIPATEDGVNRTGPLSNWTWEPAATKEQGREIIRTAWPREQRNAMTVAAIMTCDRPGVVALFDHLGDEGGATALECLSAHIDWLETSLQLARSAEARAFVALGCTEIDDLPA